MTVTLRLCYLCGREATPGLFVKVGTNYRCKSGLACQTRIRSRAVCPRCGSWSYRYCHYCQDWTR